MEISHEFESFSSCKFIVQIYLILSLVQTAQKGCNFSWHVIISVIIEFNYMETIDENIDKKNTRRLVQLALGSQSLRDQDYQSLGKL